tara:strand:- start:188 stop:994 length:807 start_codon:yes stop_codon:yes gene_type:complete
MKKKRLIPILLLKNGSLVQSRNFVKFQKIGSPIPAVKRLSQWASDELIYLDISRDNNYDINRDDLKFTNSNNILDIIEHISKETFMPITIGGKIKTLKDIEIRLKKCADKVSINSEAYRNRNFIKDAAKEFGSQCIVGSVDVKKINDEYEVFVDHGKTATKIKITDWIKILQDLGIGEILLNSIDRDGLGQGYDLELINKIDDIVKVPLIISGGVGKYEDFEKGLNFKSVDAVAAANIFHYKDQSLFFAKKFLFEKGLNVREPKILKI